MRAIAAALLRRAVAALLAIAVLWAEGAHCSRGVSLNPGSLPRTSKTGADAIAPSPGPTADAADGNLSRPAVIGIAVGATVGGVILATSVTLLVCLLCRRATSAKKHSAATPDKTVPSSRARNYLRKGPRPSKARGKGSGPAMPADKGPAAEGERLATEVSSDSEFVLPELGGKDPHIKFDGMEWVDIKGLDDDTLQDISTDLRVYHQRHRP